MSRYFFNIHNDDGVELYDDVGVHLATRADIHRRMMSMAIDLVDGMRPDDAYASEQLGAAFYLQVLRSAARINVLR